MVSCLKNSVSKSLEELARGVARYQSQSAGKKEGSGTSDESGSLPLPSSARVVSGRRHHRLRMRADHLMCRDGRSEESLKERTAVRTLAARRNHQTNLGKFLKFVRGTLHTCSSGCVWDTIWHCEALVGGVCVHGYTPFPPCCVLAWLPKTSHGVGCELKWVLCLWAVGYALLKGVCVPKTSVGRIVKERALALVEDVEIDGVLVAYSNDCLVQGFKHKHGLQLLAAVMERWPSFSRNASRKLPRFHLCLNGWRQHTPARI